MAIDAGQQGHAWSESSPDILESCTATKQLEPHPENTNLSGKLLALSAGHHSGLFRTIYNLRPESKSVNDAGKGNNPGHDWGSGSSDLGGSVDQKNLALSLATLTAHTPRWDYAGRS
jgi:hypothetical protein